MARTYDVMVGLVLELRPDLSKDLINPQNGKPWPVKLVPVLDEHFPVEGGWGTKPLHEGEKLLRERIATQDNVYIVVLKAVIMEDEGDKTPMMKFASLDEAEGWIAAQGGQYVLSDDLNLAQSE